MNMDPPVTAGNSRKIQFEEAKVDLPRKMLSDIHQLKLPPKTNTPPIPLLTRARSPSLFSRRAMPSTPTVPATCVETVCSATGGPGAPVTMKTSASAGGASARRGR